MKQLKTNTMQKNLMSENMKIGSTPENYKKQKLKGLDRDKEIAQWMKLLDDSDEIKPISELKGEKK